MDIANFYRDVLEDKKEAILTYETILARFPGNPNTASVYYNLYRLYSETNVAQSDKYKNILLKDFPQTPFAKVILDPEFSRRLGDEDTGFSLLYNKVYDLYAAKQYQQVIGAADALLQQYPNNRYAAQLYYLRAFAAGHHEKLEPFRTDLVALVGKYPDDQLITPLVNQHLAYINVNQAELAARSVVLGEKNDTEFTIPIVYQQKTEYRVPFTGSREIVADVRAPEKKPVEPPVKAAEPVITPPTTPVIANQPAVTELAKQPVTDAPQQAAQPVIAPVVVPAKVVPSVFSSRDTTNYYFVVNVNSATTNLASSRFGIGQFNRVNYAGQDVKHRLRNAGQENQLIDVGRFYSLESAKAYARTIIPLLPDIMKVSEG